MKFFLKLLSTLGLILTAVPSVLYFLGEISQGTSHLMMILGMIFWFISAPFWINSKVNKS
jgi:multisubunit Na+/H+ antiporter MnhG subunit